MLVRFTNVSFLNNTFETINNVIWVRLTQNKVIIECQDGRRFERRIKNLLDFEVIHS